MWGDPPSLPPAHCLLPYTHTQQDETSPVWCGDTHLRRPLWLTITQWHTHKHSHTHLRLLLRAVMGLTQSDSVDVHRRALSLSEIHRDLCGDVTNQRGLQSHFAESPRPPMCVYESVSPVATLRVYSSSMKRKNMTERLLSLVSLNDKNIQFLSQRRAAHFMSINYIVFFTKIQKETLKVIQKVCKFRKMKAVK